MDLSDSEKRDLIKLIESNKPLPDQYRFRLFEKSDEIELLWNGKSNEITNVNLPFQIIEQVDEPRKEIEPSLQGNLFDERGRKLRGWTNKLIWGNNSLVLSSLINGPLREEIQQQGGLKLVYIDPPFNVGDDFEFDINIGNQTLSKKRNALEQLAFSDTWGKQEDSFLSMMYERLKLIHALMSNDGCLFVHCDWRVSFLLRSILNEIFGADAFVNEIIWRRRLGKTSPDTNRLENTVDNILFYSKSLDPKINFEYTKFGSEDYLKDSFKNEDEKGRRYQSTALNAPVKRPTLVYDFMGYKPHPNGWSVSKETMQKYYEEDKLIFPKNKDGRIRRKQYLDEWKGYSINSLWTDISAIPSQSKERLSYPTQKPELFLDRIIKLCSNENDLIADFFCGSGTTLAVAEKLNRKWIGCDLGKFAIHTSRKRLINVQRDKEKEGKHFRPFEVLNLGKYQREFFIKDYLFNERNLKNEQAEEHYYQLILDAYKAKKLENLGIIKGIKNNRAIAVGPFNLQVTRLFVEEVIKECALKKITTVDILGFEFEMGLFPNIRDVASKQGVDLNCLYIPNDIFDKKAVKKHQIIFYNTAYIDAQIITKKDEFSVKLKGYSVFDSDNQFEEALSELEKGEKREILMKNSIIKIHKDKDGKINKNIIKMKWDDWVDYWSVDFDFENKKEFIREDGKDKPTGDFIFENEWQSFRTKETEIEFETPFRKIIKGKKIAVKVIDIFGNDTMKILEL
jgi:adenine-specific DNA-methyltransferase